MGGMWSKNIPYMKLLRNKIYNNILKLFPLKASMVDIWRPALIGWGSHAFWSHHGKNNSDAEVHRENTVPGNSDRPADFLQVSWQMQIKGGLAFYDQHPTSKKKWAFWNRFGRTAEQELPPPKTSHSLKLSPENPSRKAWSLARSTSGRRWDL